MALHLPEPLLEYMRAHASKQELRTLRLVSKSWSRDVCRMQTGLTLTRFRGSLAGLPALRSLNIAGHGLSWQQLQQLQLPRLASLVINCELLSGREVLKLLEVVGPRLQHLHLKRAALPPSLHTVLSYLPVIHSLHLSYSLTASAQDEGEAGIARLAKLASIAAEGAVPTATGSVPGQSERHVPGEVSATAPSAAQARSSTSLPRTPQRIPMSENPPPPPGPPPPPIFSSSSTSTRCGQVLTMGTPPPPPPGPLPPPPFPQLHVGTGAGVGAAAATANADSNAGSTGATTSSAVGGHGSVTLRGPPAPPPPPGPPPPPCFGPFGSSSGAASSMRPTPTTPLHVQCVHPAHLQGQCQQHSLGSSSTAEKQVLAMSSNLPPPPAGPLPPPPFPQYRVEGVSGLLPAGVPDPYWHNVPPSGTSSAVQASSSSSAGTNTPLPFATHPPTPPPRPQPPSPMPTISLQVISHNIAEDEDREDVVADGASSGWQYRSAATWVFRVASSQVTTAESASLSAPTEEQAVGPSLRKLVLEQVFLDAAGMSELAQLTQLTHLSLLNPQPTPWRPEHVEHLNSLTGLRSLTILCGQGSRCPKPSHIWSLTPHLRLLTHLDLELHKTSHAETYTAEEWYATLGAFPSLHHLRLCVTPNISSHPSLARNLKALQGACGQLTHLEVYTTLTGDKPQPDGKATDADLEWIAQHMPNLHYLSVGQSGAIIRAAGVKHISSLHHLTYLNLANCTAVPAAQLTVLQNLPHLERVDLTNQLTLTDTTLGQALGHACGLTHLCLRGCWKVALSDTNAIHVTQAWPHLMFMDLRETRAGTMALQQLAGLSQLKVLRLHQCWEVQPGTALEQLAKGRAASTLIALDVGLTNLCNADASSLAKLTALTALDVSHTYIHDAGVQALCSGLQDLQYLDMAYTNITDTALACLSSLPRIRFLDLRHCRGLTNAGLGAITEHRPPELVRMSLDRCWGINIHTIVDQWSRGHREPWQLAGPGDVDDYWRNQDLMSMKI